MGVCVCHHHSPVNSLLCVYVCICMPTPLDDCDYIRQYFTVNYEVLRIKNSIVFPIQLHHAAFFVAHAKKKKYQALSHGMPIIILPSIIREE